MTIDKLLTRYMDLLNEGKNIDVEGLLQECPDEDKDEFLRLIKISAIFQKSTSNYTITPTRRHEMLEKMEKARQESCGHSYVAGIACRTEQQDEENKQKIEDKLAEIRSRYSKKEE